MSNEWVTIKEKFNIRLTLQPLFIEIFNHGVGGRSPAPLEQGWLAQALLVFLGP